MISPSGSAPPSPPRRGRRPFPRAVARHLRAAVVLVAIAVLASGIAYPAVVTVIAQEISPGSANGSLLIVDGTIVGSSLIAQNISAPYLFWARPSLNDYNLTLGYDGAPGPTTAALRALVNETVSYMERYGNHTVNATLPITLISVSGSGVDPDLVPQAVLVQIPRVSAFASNVTGQDVSIANLTALVNREIVPPILPGFGVPYVDVLSLDLALLSEYPALLPALGGP
ncbi:MAG: potassium-transporting ATPase subunit C [Thermoplasmata archaeon]